MFQWFLLKAIACAWNPTLTVLSQIAYFVQLYVWMCIMFWKTSSERHCFCLKPTTHCTFTDRILCSLVCFQCVQCVEKSLLKAIASAWRQPLNVLSQSAYIVQLYVWMCKMFWQTSFETHCFCLKPTTHCTFTERILFSFVCLNEYNVSMTSSENQCLCLKPNTHCTFTERIFVQLYGLLCLMFWKTSSDSHCSCLKPTTQCTFTELILCSIVCLNVYFVLKKIFWKPLLLLEAHHSVYFYRAHILCNCMFECVNCFWKTFSESHCYCLKPTTYCTFTERIHCSNVCLNMYNVFKNFLWNPLLLLEAHHSLYFHRAHTLFNCMFECSYCFEKNILEAIASAWSPPLSVPSKSAYFVHLYVWICIMFQGLPLKSIACAWSPPLTVFSQIAYFVQLWVWMCIMSWKTSSENYTFSWKPTTHCTSTERLLCSIKCLTVCNVLETFFWKPFLLLEAHHSLYFHRAHTLFNCMFECVYCFEKLLLKDNASTWSPQLTVLSQSA